MSKIIPINITTTSIIIAGIKFKFDTPLAEIYENNIDKINVTINTSKNHFISEFSLFIITILPFSYIIYFKKILITIFF